MSDRVATIIGSGTVPFTRAILPLDQRGSQAGSEGVRTGLQVVVANPEDLTSVDAFAASGITVGTNAVAIIGPTTNPLPRCREVILQNTGAAPVYISHKPSFTTQDSFELPIGGTAGVNRRVALPILHNVTVYARTASGSSSVRLLIY